MLGKKLYKNNPADMAQYTELAVWCNANNATIEDKGEYYECVEIPPYVPTEEEIQQQLENGVEAYMNSKVAEKHYDSIDTCIGRYLNSPNEQYRKEATAVMEWNTAVWDKCWAILAEVKAGTRPVPTLDEVIAELPPLEW